VTEHKRRITCPSEGLIRRVWKDSPKRFRLIIDQLTGRPRAPAAAFELRLADPTKPERTVDEALSVNIESSLQAAGLELTWGMDVSRQYAVRITVDICHANGLEAYYDPTPINPHHGSIWDLVAMFSEDRDRYERTINALAKASTVVHDATTLDPTTNTKPN
jgi:hypothetical protein